MLELLFATSLSSFSLYLSKLTKLQFLKLGENFTLAEISKPTKNLFNITLVRSARILPFSFGTLTRRRFSHDVLDFLYARVKSSATKFQKCQQSEVEDARSF